MKLNKLIDPRFKKVVLDLQSAVIPLKGAYKLKGIVKAIDEEFNKYDELRMATLKKFGKKDDQGNLVLDEKGDAHLEEEAMKQFVAELQDLINLDVDVPKMSINDLGDNVNMSVEDLRIVEDLFES